MSSIFKAYDIRGVYGDDLTDEMAYLIGYYLVDLLNLEELKVSSDYRNSYKNLMKFFIQGVIDNNCSIIYIGQNSTPNFYFSLFKGVNSGVQITASHNSKEYNGFKFMINMNSFDSRNGLKDLEILVNEDKDNRKESFKFLYDSINVENLEDFIDNRDIQKEFFLDDYIRFLESFAKIILTDKDLECISNLMIGFDFSNGMSSQALKSLVNNLNLKSIFWGDKIDGDFPNHLPEPNSALSFIKNEVKEDLDFIFVFDGDGDRLGVFDENKEIVFLDYVISMFIDYFVKYNDSKKFVCDLRVSKVVVDMAIEKDFHLDLIRVGRSFYQDYLINNNCKFGAELSGHFFFKEFHNLDNPDVGIIYFLKILSTYIRENNIEKGDFKLSKVIKKFDKYYKLPERKFKVKDQNKVLEKIKEIYNKYLVLEIDGYSFECEGFWFNIRKSNTEPIIRINFEGIDKEVVDKEYKKLINVINDS